MSHCLVKLRKLALTNALVSSNIIMGFNIEVDSVLDKKKVGRPTDNPKGISIHVRLDEECSVTLEKYCKQEQVTKMEAIRRGIKKLAGDIVEK